MVFDERNRHNDLRIIMEATGFSERNIEFRNANAVRLEQANDNVEMPISKKWLRG